MKLFKNNKANISIDFGSSSIKIVEGQVIKSEIDITKFESLDIPKDLYSDGKILNEAKLIDIFREFLNINNFNMKLNAYAVVNSSSIINRKTSIPKVKEDEISSLISFQIEEFLPINQEDYVVDYLILDKIQADEKERINILLIAMPKEIVLSHLNLMKEVGLEPIALDLQGNVISKLLSFNENINNEHIIQDNTIVSIDLGYTKTEVTISINENIEVSRAIDIGSKKIYESISELLGFTEDDIENQIMKIQGIYELEDINEKNKIEILFKSSLEDVMERINKIIKYYDSREFGNTVHLIVLQGGISNIPGIEKKFTEYFHIPTVKLKDLDKVEFEGDLSIYTNAIGGLIRREVKR